MKHKLSIFLFALLMQFSVLGQYVISGTLRDAETLDPLPDALVFSPLDSSTTITDDLGFFTLTGKSKISISSLGYATQVFNVRANKYLNITLEPSLTQLTEVVVLGTHQAVPAIDGISAISILGKRNLEVADPIDYSYTLNQVSGVFMHSGTYNTNRITIRGIGSRNLFGTAKLRTYFGNIPLTDGSGVSAIEDVELSDVKRIEVVKGPSGAQYGAGLAGAIVLYPDYTPPELSSVSASLGWGSYDLARQQFALRLGGNKHQLKLTASNTSSLGYRENSTYKRTSINLFSNHQLGEKDRLELVGSIGLIDGEIPSSIDSITYVEAPTEAASSWNATAGKERYFRMLGALNWAHDFRNVQQNLAVFFNRRSSDEIRPFNILDEINTGIGFRWRWEGDLLNDRLQWMLGTESLFEQYDWGTFENNYENNPNEVPAPVQGMRESQFLEKRNLVNFFSNINYSFSSKVKLSLGANLNFTHYDLLDQFNHGAASLSGDNKFSPIVSPKLGVNVRVTPLSALYGNFSHGFSSPTVEETLLPDGLINTDIQPEKGWNAELGWRGDFKRQKGYFSFAGYLLSVQNLLVARRTGQDEFIGVNAGKSRNIGWEADLKYRLIKKKGTSVYFIGMFNIQQFKFIDFEDDGFRFDGNYLPGLPQYRHRLEIAARFPLRISLSIQQETVGEMFLRDDNELSQSGYNLVHVGIFHKISFGKWRFDWSLKYNNLFNEKYAAMLLINAGSFGGQAPRYYYPGRPRQVYGKISLSRFF